MPSTVKSSLYSRKTQFDLWKFDEQWIGKPVFISTSLDSISIKNNVDGQIVEGMAIEQYQSDASITINFDSTFNSVKNNSVLGLDANITNIGNSTISFSDRQQPLEIVAIFLNKKDLFTFKALNPIITTDLLSKTSSKLNLQFKISEIPAGSYKFALGFMTFAGPVPHTVFTAITVN